MCSFLRLFQLLTLLFSVYSAYASIPYIYLGFGAGLAKIGKSQNYSPIDGLINYYSADSTTEVIAPLVSLGAGYRFDINHNYYASLGIEGDYVNYGDLKGVLHPGVNIGPNFNTLNYSYSAESYLLMFKGKFGFTNHTWLPYISLGIGFSLNQLGNYSEGSDNTSAPAQILYERNSKGDKAYSIGVGLYQYRIRNNINLSIGYRFIYSGSGTLENPISRSDSISSGMLAGHFITLSINIL
jgi:hypothetical protein